VASSSTSPFRSVNPKSGSTRGGNDGRLSRVPEKKPWSASRPTMFLPRRGIAERGNSLSSAGIPNRADGATAFDSHSEAVLLIGRPEQPVDDQLLIGHPLSS
jgi:hypothetical protein